MKAYAIKDPKGKILIETVQLKKKRCTDQYDINNYKSLILVGWNHYYKAGYRCVPVLITEVKGEK